MYAFPSALPSSTHLCPPVEFLQGRDGVAEACLSRRLGRQLGRAWPGQAGLGPLSRRRPARTPTLPRARALLGRGHPSSSGRFPGHAGRGSAAGWTRDPGGPGLSSDPFSKCGPFPSLWESFQEDLLFFNISFRRTIKKKKKNGGAEHGPFRGGQHFSVLTPTWQPSGFSAAPAPKPSS